jgi:hypothetical protein
VKPMRRPPTILQLAIMRRVARSGWDNVSGPERRSAARRPDLLLVELDEEGSDRFCGDYRYVACLTADGASHLSREHGVVCCKQTDGSYLQVEQPSETL